MSNDEEKVKIIDRELLRAKEIQINIYRNLYQMDSLVPLDMIYEMSIKDLNLMIQAIEDQQQLNKLHDK